MNFTIRKRVLLIALIPTIALLVYSVLGILNGIMSLKEAQNNLFLAELTVKSDELVHELQKERGRTAGFLGSGGKKWQKELVIQRRRTDKKRRELKQLLLHFDKDRYGDVFRTLLQDSLSRLSRLSGLREQVSNQKIDSIAGIEFYSNLNNSFLKTIFYIPALIGDGDISKKFLAMGNFINAKEKAGIERAILSDTFSHGAFTNENVFSLFISLVDAQELAMDNLYSTSGKGITALLKEMVKDPAFAEVERFRGIAKSYSRKKEVTGQLMHFMGYGGLIHTFKNYLLRGQDKYVTAFNAGFPEAMKIIAKYNGLTGISQREKDALVIIRKTLTQYDVSFKRAQQLTRQGNSISSIDKSVKIDDGPAIAASVFLAKGGSFDVNSSQWFDTITKKINLLQQIQSQLSSRLQLNVTEYKDSALRRFYIILLSTLLILLVTGYLIIFDMRKRISQPIDTIVQSLKEAVAQADLTRRINLKSNDELGEISSWFNKFFERVHDIVLNVKKSSVEILHFTGSISTGTDDLSEHTKEQAASITETSATLEQFTFTVKRNSENADEANQVLESFNKEIGEMQKLIASVTDTMEEINSSSEKIDSIISVINDISFQTNLLALNAAVEAARAGEAGRGFAVVAAEVRNLAQKTAQSSKSIREIVTNNVESTQKGKALVNQTSEFFQSILKVVFDLAAKTKQIAEGSREQSIGIEQINQAVSQLESIINSNANLVEEFNATSKSMNSNANELHELVALFNVDEATA